MIGMKIQKPIIRLNNLIISLSKGVDLVSTGILNHHKNVTIISLKIAEAIGLDKEHIEALYIAAMMHDIGVISQKERGIIEQYDYGDLHKHALEGYKILSVLPNFNNIATIIKHHHDKWSGNNSTGVSKFEIPILSQIIFLADRVEILFRKTGESLTGVEDINKKIFAGKNKLFNKDLVDVFFSISKNKAFWLDLRDDFSDELLVSISPEIYSFSIDVLVDLCYAMAYVVDRKSPFTSKHSQRVANVAKEMSLMYKLSPKECDQMFLAGLLHDIGKLAVSEEILNKPGRLSEYEMNIMMTHTYYTYHLLKHIKEFPGIEEWAGFHHEKLNGKGYPFGIDKNGLSLPSRILAVSDIFTALTEDRPYRKGLDEKKLKKILKEMVENGEIDGDITELVLREYDKFYNIVHSIEGFFSVAEKRKERLKDNIIEVEPWTKVQMIP